MGIACLGILKFYTTGAFSKADVTLFVATYTQQKSTNSKRTWI